MTLKEMLDSLTPEAVEFLQDTINTGNSGDHLKLKKIMDDRLFEARSFDDARVDISNFDWQESNHDRNWWWQLQPLHFLAWYCNSFKLQNADERARNYAKCRDAVLWWMQQSAENENSPLVWHDHVTAFRLRNLVNWVVFCYLNNMDVVDDPLAAPLSDLIFRHLVWLKEDANYSRHTNHGFDQAMMALVAALMFSDARFAPYRNINRDRLQEELAFSFTEQGVHKENSPGYQKSMLNRLNQLGALTALGEDELSEVAQRYVDAATGFLRAITLPNGFLPMIGDTRGAEKGLPYIQRDDMDVLDYSVSGYVILRGKVLGRDFHLVFKNGHLSQYHRHDDDLSLHLYFDGRVFLGDGGLGSHNEADPQRILVRSSIAHNAPYIVGAQPLRIPARLNGFAPKIIVTDGRILGESYAHGVSIRREVDFSQISRGRILVKDTAINERATRLASNFFATSGFSSRDGALYSNSDGDYVLRIESVSHAIFSPQESVFSSEFGKFSRVSAMSLFGQNGADRNTIDFTLDLLPATPGLPHSQAGTSKHDS